MNGSEYSRSELKMWSGAFSLEVVVQHFVSTSNQVTEFDLNWQRISTRVNRQQTIVFWRVCCLFQARFGGDRDAQIQFSKNEGVSYRIFWSYFFVCLGVLCDAFWLSVSHYKYCVWQVALGSNRSILMVKSAEYSIRSFWSSFSNCSAKLSRKVLLCLAPVECRARK